MVESAEVPAGLPPDGETAYNRLIHETSPYLLQHARNPVDWHPWGDEAFRRAKKEKKPIFLSIGYSTCHWCHVMERESFEREDVAALLNEYFVPIKVDREERPEIDAFYLNATQLLTGGGGWPNSVWLTPEGKPWYAGTYFPPEDRWGRPGFKSILKRLAELWRVNREEVEEEADRVDSAVRQLSADEIPAGDEEPDEKIVAGALDSIRRSFDREYGGFGSSPKFPPHGSLDLIFCEYRKDRDEALLELAVETLSAMARGGIHDQIGGGFHRYSTDRRWLLPHFEKMLYDNARLARSYVDGYLITGKEEFAAAARDTYDWVLREMTDREGGFYSALDADSEGKEGKFYLWGRDEIIEVLGKDEGELFCRVYGVEAGGNFRDEATGGAGGLNVIHLPRGLGEAARAEKLEAGRLREGIAASRKKLLDRRGDRVRPHLDDKVLTDWNGLMIGSLAYGGKNLQEPRYLEAARKAAGFILKTMRKDGRLLHTYRKGRARLPAYLDDYAFLISGLLDLSEAGGDKRWLRQARSLTGEMLNRHFDESAGGFFFTAEDNTGLLGRSKSPYDRATPSGNGMGAFVLVRLAELDGGEGWREKARLTLQAFQGAMERSPRGSESLVLALSKYLKPPPVRLEEGHVTVELLPPPGKPKPGGPLPLSVRLAIDKGWHINSHEPLQDYLIPTRLELVDSPSWELEEVAYPPGEKTALRFSPEELSVYGGEVIIKLALRPVGGKTGPEGKVGLKVTFQPCSDTACGLPRSIILPVNF